MAHFTGEIDSRTPPRTNRILPLPNTEKRRENDGETEGRIAENGHCPCCHYCSPVASHTFDVWLRPSGPSVSSASRKSRAFRLLGVSEACRTQRTFGSSRGSRTLAGGERRLGQPSRPEGLALSRTGCAEDHSFSRRSRLVCAQAGEVDELRQIVAVMVVDGGQQFSFREEAADWRAVYSIRNMVCGRHGILVIKIIIIIIIMGARTVTPAKGTTCYI